MNDRARQISAPLARWSSRTAIFAASLLVIGLVLHRLTSFPTPVAMNLFLVAFAGAALALLVGLVALAQIWHSGYAGAGSAAIGIFLPLLMAAWPLAYVQTYLKSPPLNDVTTDLTTPPRFVALARQRVQDKNGPIYPGRNSPKCSRSPIPTCAPCSSTARSRRLRAGRGDAARLKWKVSCRRCAGR